MLAQTDPMDANGTSLSGYIDAEYTKLIEVFGPPTGGDGYKVDAEWVLKDEDTGDVVTIYNFKNGPSYLGDEGTAVKDITEWHVGGFRVLADVDLVLAALKGEDEDLTDDDGYPVTPSPLV